MHFECLLKVLAVDPSLGRLDYDSLSDQALMEMLIEGLDDEVKENYQDANGGYLDVCEWTAVECTDDRVTSIDISWGRMNEKQFPFEFIPALTQDFEIFSSNMHGTLDTGVLPSGLVRIQVSINNLHGELNFGAFPRKLERIHIDRNSFGGSCMLSDLPDALTIFSARENKLSGGVLLSDLPAAMEVLILSQNALSGDILLNDLPMGMKELNLSQNNLSGGVQINDLPAAMRSLDLSYNKLSGSISIERLPQSMNLLNFMANEFTGELRLMAFTPRHISIDVSQNALSETAVLRKATGKMPFSLWHSCIKVVMNEDGNPHEWQGAIEKTRFKSAM